jgi:type IX secretion system PorP/SprF family membrane protein
MKKKLFFLSILASCALTAQDFHYSMFTMAPLTLNPALTGNFTGDIRIVNNYRMQWPTVSKAYKTYTLGVDMPIMKRDRRNASPDFFAVGLNANVDKAGSSKLRNNAYNACFSYNKSLDGIGMTYFSLGGSAGMSQRSISLDGSSWDMQFNGLAYDPSLPTGEINQADSYLYFDFAAGAAMTTVANDRFKMSGGLSVSHLSKPSVDFLGYKDKLYMRFCGHYNAQIAIGANSNAWLTPVVQYVQQGPARLINAGVGIKCQLSQRSHYTNYQSDKFFSIGGMYRMADAVSMYTRFDYDAFGIGFNYDFNVSRLTTASKGVGAFEFMVIYTGMFGPRNGRMSNPSFF